MDMRRHPARKEIEVKQAHEIDRPQQQCRACPSLPEQGGDSVTRAGVLIDDEACLLPYDKPRIDSPQVLDDQRTLSSMQHEKAQGLGQSEKKYRRKQKRERA